MSKWIKEVPVSETRANKEYFIAKGSKERGFLFWSRLLNGSLQWSSKPGIAIRYNGGKQLISDFERNNTHALVAIEVPADADRRWKARKRRY